MSSSRLAQARRRARAFSSPPVVQSSRPERLARRTGLATALPNGLLAVEERWRCSDAGSGNEGLRGEVFARRAYPEGEKGADGCICRVRRTAQRKLERVMGIEPTSWAWEAQVMAIIRHPLSGRLFTKNSS